MRKNFQFHYLPKLYISFNCYRFSRIVIYCSLNSCFVSSRFFVSREARNSWRKSGRRPTTSTVRTLTPGHSSSCTTPTETDSWTNSSSKLYSSKRFDFILYIKSNGTRFDFILIKFNGTRFDFILIKFNGIRICIKIAHVFKRLPKP